MEGVRELLHAFLLQLPGNLAVVDPNVLEGCEFGFRLMDIVLDTLKALIYTHLSVFLSAEYIAQEEMALPTFDPDKRPPQWILWGKTLASDKSWSFDVPVSPSNLRGERQEEFIQGSFCKEVPHQLWPTLDQDQVAVADLADRLQNVPGAERTSALHCQDLDSRRKALFVDALRAVSRSDDQGANFTRLEYREGKVDRPICGNNHVQRWFRLPQA